MAKRNRNVDILLNKNTPTKKLIKIIDAIMWILSDRGELKNEHITAYEYVMWYQKYKVNNKEDKAIG